MVLMTPPRIRDLKSLGEVPRRLKARPRPCRVALRRGLGMTSKAGRAKTGRESKNNARRLDRYSARPGYFLDSPSQFGERKPSPAQPAMAGRNGQPCSDSSGPRSGLARLRPALRADAVRRLHIVLAL